MSFTEKRLCGPIELTNSFMPPATVYTVPTGKTTIIKQIVVSNRSENSRTFSLSIGTDTGAFLFSETPVAANDTLIINLSQVLNSGDNIYAFASAVSSINLTISGVENDGPLNPLSTYIADGAITSAKIADGSIVNADINASAAIAQSKIASLTSDLALKANLASPTFTGTFNASNFLLVDSSGRVSKPANPAFSAYPSGNFTLANIAVVPHNLTLFNIGSCYNTANYRFTAPIAGIYQFCLNLNVYNVDTTAYFMPALYKNGTGLHYGDKQNGQGGIDANANVNAVVYLAVNDYVEPFCLSNDASYQISGGSSVWNSFSGCLIG